MTVPLEVGVDRLGRSFGKCLGHLLGSAVPAVAPAVALVVWRSGEPAFEAFAGWMDPDSPSRRLRREALFDLASLSKLFTATAFLGLVSDGIVGLDDPVVRVVPELGASGPRAVDGGQEPLSRQMLPVPPERAGWSVDPVVTFRQLLSHTSGLAPWRSVFLESGPVPPPPDEPDPVGETRLNAGLAAVCGYPFVDRPGRAVHYSDLGFMILGESVSRLARAPLENVVRERVSGPLELDSMGYAPVRAGILRDRVIPTSVDDDWRRRRCWGEVEDENAAGLGGVAGHAGLFGSAADVARFGQAWLERAPRLGIARAVMDEAVRVQTRGVGDRLVPGERQGTEDRRGLGWQIRPTDQSAGDGAREAPHLSPLGVAAFGHTGFTGTSLAIDPSRELVVALLTDRVYAGRAHEGIDDLRLVVTDVLGRALPSTLA